MISAIAFLPLVALVLNDAQVERVENILSVTLATSEPIAVERVKGMTGPQRMYVFLKDTTASQKTYPSAHGPVVAHARARYTKLEIPTGPGGRCLEPVTVAATATGVRLRALCNDAAAPLALAHHQGLAGVIRTNSNTKPSTLERSKAEEIQLRQALLPPGNEGIGGTDKGNESAVDTPRKGNEEKAVEETVAERDGVAPITAAATIAQSPSEKDQRTVPASTTSVLGPASNSAAVLGGTTAKPEGGFSMILAVLVLAGLGLFAFLLARRRVAHGRIIHILETASIGAKRSLVVATVGGRTMVLGVSEAGVALLDSTNAPAKEAPQSKLSEMDEAPLEDELPLGRLAALRRKLRSTLTGGKKASVEEFLGRDMETMEPEGKSEGGVLGRLFAHRPAERVDPEPTFQEVLDDSYEDQQLRQKLAAGMGGRVA